MICWKTIQIVGHISQIDLDKVKASQNLIDINMYKTYVSNNSESKFSLSTHQDMVTFCCSILQPQKKPSQQNLLQDNNFSHLSFHCKLLNFILVYLCFIFSWFPKIKLTPPFYRTSTNDPPWNETCHAPKIMHVVWVDDPFLFGQKTYFQGLRNVRFRVRVIVWWSSCLHLLEV